MTRNALRNQRGFTLMEVLLSIAFFGVLAGMSVPVIQHAQTRNDAVLAANVIEQSVRRAQVLSRNGIHELPWGVDVRAGTVTVFGGESYATRNTDYDEVFTIPASIAMAPATEMVFTPLYGQLSQAETITITDPGGTSITLTISAEGVVNR